MRINKAGRYKNRYTALLILAATLLLAYAGYRVLTDESAGELTPEQAGAAVLQEYPGSIGKLVLQSGQYVAELQTAQGRYQLKLDGSTGEIVSIVLLEAAATARPTPQPSAPSGTAGSAAPSASPTPGRIVGEAEAIRLAQQEVPGEVDDVDTEIGEFGVFYLVEIKTADDREAIVQVDAITGSILSVTWEDEDDDPS